MATAHSEIRLVPQTIALPTYTLSPDQLLVTAHQGSPLIVKGATGTGKTTAAIEFAISRIKAGAPVDSILFLSYGRDIAATVRDRIVATVGGTVQEPVSRTFHSLAFSILSAKISDQHIDTVLISGAEQESLIRELLQGDIDSGYKSWPPELQASPDTLGEPLATQGFIRELRDLMMRATERRFSPDDLRTLGLRLGEKYWPAAADFWNQYLDVSELMSRGAADSKRRIDPAQLITSATDFLRANPDYRQKLRQQFRTIIVDEFHESDPAQRDLLLELAGEDLLVVVDPTVAVGRFRGADPDGIFQWLDSSIHNATHITLETHFRSPSKKIARQCVSQNEEAQYIAYCIKRAHLIDKVPYSEMAVIVRNHGATSSAIRRALAQSSIPVEGDRQAIAENAALQPFLLLARIASSLQPLTYDACEQLLTSEFGGASSLSLRRIRTALLNSRDTAVDTRNGAQMIIDAIDNGDIPIQDASELLRVHQLLTYARQSLRKKNAHIHDLLGAIWDNAVNSDGIKISESWQSAAIKGGVRGAEADRDLDAMIQLFDSAARHMDRLPGSSPERFLNEIAQENIMSDVIAFRGVRPDVVQLLTVHNSKGHSFRRVFVAGLQEGQWPNLKQRSSLLGAERLVERIRHGEEVATVTLDLITAESLLEDEKRLFKVALTRASEEVHITAFNHEEDIPSTFFISAIESDGFVESTSAMARPITANALVADLRRNLDGPDTRAAASLLSTLSHQGIAVADPDQWTGALAQSTTEPLSADGELVRLSPSAADSFDKCELKWLLEKNGGTNGDSARALLGSIIHEYARKTIEQPGTTKEEFLEHLTHIWPAISDQSGWLDRNALTRARRLLDRFFLYHSKSTNSVHGVELGFEFTLGRTHIKGSIDRVEVTTDGSYVVVDFKTGKAITAKDGQKNLQLACYQLAVVLDSLADKLPHPSTPAPVIAKSQLVFLGHKAESFESMHRYRDPIDIEVISADLTAMGERMAGATFMAKKNIYCAQCPVKIACPVYFEGATVIG